MKLPFAIITLSLILGPVTGCDGGEKKSIADQIGPATKNTNELKTKVVDEEELKRRRREAGFKTKEEVDAELAAENAKVFEKGDRLHIKARIADYRGLTTETRKLIDELEKEATKWIAAKDPAKAFAKPGEALRKRAKDLLKSLDKLSEGGAKGGNTQVVLNKAFRPFEELVAAIAAELAKEEAFADTLKTIREALTEAEAAFTDIENDESLVLSDVNKPDDE